MLKPFGREGRRELAQAASASTVGIEMGLAVAIGYSGGHWLDAQLATDPYLTTFGLLIGFGAGFKGIGRLIKKYRAETQKSSDA